jgi:hypothetical protein
METFMLPFSASASCESGGFRDDDEEEISHHTRREMFIRDQNRKGLKTITLPPHLADNKLIFSSLSSRSKLFTPERERETNLEVTFQSPDRN